MMPHKNVRGHGTGCPSESPGSAGIEAGRIKLLPRRPRGTHTATLPETPGSGK